VDRDPSGASAPIHESQPAAEDAGAEERALVAAVLRKDRKAAARLVAAHIDAIYAYVRHRLTPREDFVDDVVQEVFLAALNGLAAFQGHSSLRGWLIGVARHKVEDLYRRRLRVREDNDSAAGLAERPSEAPAFEAQLDWQRTRGRTRKILARIPEHYGLMLLWRYWEQRSVREIASALGTTEKSVERTLARARERFKQAWLERERER
jgi:RNA polymerase sigma-70 factor, ECF subfamily